MGKEHRAEFCPAGAKRSIFAREVQLRRSKTSQCHRGVRKHIVKNKKTFCSEGTKNGRRIFGLQAFMWFDKRNLSNGRYVLAEKMNRNKPWNADNCVP